MGNPYIENGAKFLLGGLHLGYVKLLGCIIVEKTNGNPFVLFFHNDSKKKREIIEVIDFFSFKVDIYGIPERNTNSTLLFTLLRTQLIWTQIKSFE